MEGVKKLLEDHQKAKEPNTDLLAPGLKVRHKKSQFLYTVNAVSKDTIELLTPEGEPIVVSAKSLEDEYELD